MVVIKKMVGVAVLRVTLMRYPTVRGRVYHPILSSRMPSATALLRFSERFVVLDFYLSCNRKLFRKCGGGLKVQLTIV